MCENCVENFVFSFLVGAVSDLETRWIILITDFLKDSVINYMELLLGQFCGKMK